jgi:hypothetical protein
MRCNCTGSRAHGAHSCQNGKAMSEVPDTLVLPSEPLQDGWAERWDNDALEIRLERFGLRLKKGANGYTIHYASSGNPISIPPFDARRDCSHKEVCEFVEDLELAERLKRSGVWTELLS